MAYFGLTGGVASGKSTAAQMFADLGAQIIDADRVGHEVLSSSLSAYQEIVHRFGDEILDPSGEIDRKQLGALVFADPGKLQDLNAIVHPKIIERVEQQARQLGVAHPDAVILVDAALIFEARIGGNFRKVVVVWCEPEQQIARLMAKTGLTRAAALQRVAAQMSVAEKRQRADYLIDCSGSLEKTRAAVEALYPILKQLAEAP